LVREENEEYIPAGALPILEGGVVLRGPKNASLVC
jgi:hypothetical protein